MSHRSGNKKPTMTTNFDDWETDPDYVRHMDEIDQRWGSSRTVGSINMNELIDDVRRDHDLMREKFKHSSQKGNLEKFEKDPSAHAYQEKLSKHSSQEISRFVVTSSKTIGNREDKNDITDSKETVVKKSENSFREMYHPLVAPKPNFANLQTKDVPTRQTTTTYVKNISPKFDIQKSTFQKLEEPGQRFREEKKFTSPTSTRSPPLVFKSIQDKIDAFKKDFDDIESKISKKSDLSKVIKKTTNIEKVDNVQHVLRPDASSKISTSPIHRPVSSASSVGSQREPFKADIKSLSKKFETLSNESSEDFKRKTEVKRQEFFDQVKNQVRETRKGLEAFDTIEYMDDDDKFQQVKSKSSTQSPRFSASPSSRPSSRLSDSSSLNKPKVYTRRETTQEEFVTKLIKENDKVIENETKRNVERSSSCHGSSDEEEPTSIKFIDRQMRSSPSDDNRTKSPIDELKRKHPIVEPKMKGAGLIARALYDYTAAENDEISFDVDDLITNIDKIDSGWYRGSITKGGKKCVGLFPANHVKLLNDFSEY